MSLKYVSAVIVCAAMATQAFAYDSIATWTARVNSDLDAFDVDATQGSSDTSDARVLNWQGCRVLEALHQMHELTSGGNDTGYLQDMDRNIWNMRVLMTDNTGAYESDNDGYEGWDQTTNLENALHSSEEKFLHYGIIVEKWAKFILTVRANSALNTTYGSHADELEQQINNELLPRWDDWWSNKYLTYLDNNEPSPAETEPTNRYLAMVRAFYLMAQVTPDKAHYRMRADRMAQHFKDALTVNPESSIAYAWNKHEPVTVQDASEITPVPEDASHMTVDLAGALATYAAGGPIDSTDINAMAHTVHQVMWDGSSTNPILYDSVEGCPTGPCLADEMELEHGDLARWEPDLWALYELARSKVYTSGSPRSEHKDVQSMATILRQHPDQTTPGTVTLARPTNGATGQTGVLSFAWQPALRASHYTLQVSTSSSFSTFAVNRGKIVGTNAIARGLAHGQTYYWRVTARNHDGTLTSTSSTYSFTTKSAPTYTLTFWHSDSRGIDATKTGRHFKQVLVDGVVVWEADLFADGTSWTSQSINVTTEVGTKEHVTIELRLYEKSAVSNNGVDAYFDDVSSRTPTCRTVTLKKTGSATTSTRSCGITRRAAA